MGVPVLALFRENKIRESQYYCHSRNLNPSKFMPYTVHGQEVHAFGIDIVYCYSVCLSVNNDTQQF